MSAKNKDDKNRWRNKNVGFRCSPEEGIEIDKRWKMCGFCTKQDYILECLLHPYLIARGNPMMLISIRKELKEISVELSRIDDASEIDEELFTPIRTMLEILESFKNDEGNNREDIKMSRVIICANQKGGVGKTTTSVNLSTILAKKGKKVLMIDADPQGNASSGVGIDKDVEESVYDILINDTEIEKVAKKTNIKNLSICPSNINLAGAEVELVSMMSREYRLKEKLDPIKDNYDYIIIDCPPSLGLVTLNAFTASDSVLIPVQCEYYALEGLGQLINTFLVLPVAE